MRVIISGASGLVGRALSEHARRQGHDVVSLVRQRDTGPNEIAWRPSEDWIDAEALEGCDAVVHLAGESIAGGRWSAAKKARIRDSRVRGTALLAGALGRARRPPRVLVSASAIGYYGDRGDTWLHEDDAPGDDFLAGVCQAWETAAEPARQAGIRTVHPRIGVVLAREGGALASMLPAFRLGLGGVVGSGKQFLSWIALDDLVASILHALERDSLEGPVNAVAPKPVDQRALAKTLGAVLKRPTFLPVPAPLIRLGLGEMADALLLSSARVAAARLVASGFSFRFTDLEPALRHLLAPNRS